MIKTLGDRMKDFYEKRSQTFLPRRAYTLIRIDGKAFHTYTRGLKVPFDHDFIEDMNKTAAALCQQVQGAQFAFVQSDEISILLTDFKKFETDAWFDNNVQKMVSVSASIATAEFNKFRIRRKLSCVAPDHKEWDDPAVIGLPEFISWFQDHQMAMFDSRVWQIPDAVDVANYFAWRQQDATRNSIQSVARAYFSHKEVNGKNQNEMQDMLFTQKNINWNDYPIGCKRGRFVVRKSVKDIVNIKGQEKEIERTEWAIVDPPIFTQRPEYLASLLQSLKDEMQV